MEQKKTPQEKLQEFNNVIMRACEIGLGSLGGLESIVKDYIQSGTLDMADRHAIKFALDENIKAIEQIQELDARIRRLISEGPEDSMERASLAFLDGRTVTD